MSASLAAKNGYRLDWTDTWLLQTNAPAYQDFELSIDRADPDNLPQGLEEPQGTRRRLT